MMEIVGWENKKVLPYTKSWELKANELAREILLLPFIHVFIVEIQFVLDIVVRFVET